MTKIALSAVAISMWSGKGGQKRLLKEISPWMHKNGVKRTGLLIDAII
jgi:hypothetical protein